MQTTIIFSKSFQALFSPKYLEPKKFPSPDGFDFPIPSLLSTSHSRHVNILSFTEVLKTIFFVFSIKSPWRPLASKHCHVMWIFPHICSIAFFYPILVYNNIFWKNLVNFSTFSKNKIQPPLFINNVRCFWASTNVRNMQAFHPPLHILEEWECEKIGHFRIKEPNFAER